MRSAFRAALCVAIPLSTLTALISSLQVSLSELKHLLPICAPSHIQQQVLELSDQLTVFSPMSDH